MSSSGTVLGEPAEPGDFSGVFVAPAREADNDDLIGRPAGRFPGRPGEGMGGFQGRQNPLAAGHEVEGVESLGVGDI